MRVKPYLWRGIYDFIELLKNLNRILQRNVIFMINLRRMVTAAAKMNGIWHYIDGVWGFWWIETRQFALRLFTTQFYRIKPELYRQTIKMSLYLTEFKLDLAKILLNLNSICRPFFRKSHFLLQFKSITSEVDLSGLFQFQFNAAFLELRGNWKNFLESINLNFFSTCAYILLVVSFLLQNRRYVLLKRSPIAKQNPKQHRATSQ